MATVSYVRITGANGTVLSGDGGAAWVQVSGVSFGATQTYAPTPGGGVSAGKAALGDLTFALSQSSSLSPQLKNILAAGQGAQIEVATYDPSTATASSVGTLQSYDVFGGVRPNSAVAVLRTETLQNGDADVYAVASNQVSQAAYAGGQQVSASAFNTTTNRSVVAAATPAAVLSGTLVPTATTSTDLGALSYFIAFKTGQSSYSITDPNYSGVDPKLSGWIAIADPTSELEQTANISTGGGTGAGQIKFDPLTVTFLNPSFDATLALAVDKGMTYPIVQIEAIRPDGTVVDNTTLTTVAPSKLAKTNGVTQLTLQYGSFYSQHVAITAAGTATTTGAGWNGITNKAVTSGLQSVDLRQGPAGDAGVQPVSLPYVASVQLSSGPVVGDATLQLSPSSLPLVTGQTTSSVFQPTNVSFSNTQSVDIQSQSSGAGASKVDFSPVSFDLTADAASAAFDGALFSNTAFKQVTLAQVKRGDSNDTSVIAEKDTLKLVAVKSDDLDLLQGTHHLQLEYGAQQVAVPSYSSSGAVTGTVVGGWNRVTNLQDTDAVTGIKVNAVVSKAVASTTSAVAAVPVDPTAAAAVPVKLAAVATAAPQPTPVVGTTAYVQFRDASGKVVTGGANGSSWFALSAASTKFSQPLDIGSTFARSGAVVLGDLNLTLAPGAITAVLDRTFGAGGGLTVEVASYDGGTLLNDYVFGGAGLTADTPSNTGNALTFGYTGVQETAYTSGVASTPVTWNSATGSTAFSATTAAPVSNAPSVRRTPSQLVIYAEFVGADGKLLAGSGGKTLFAAQNVGGGLTSKNGTGAPTASPLSLSLGDDGIVSAIEGASAPVGVVLVSYDANNRGHLVSYQTYGGVTLSGDTLDNIGGDHQLTFSPASASAAPYAAAAGALAPAGYTEQMPDDFAPDGSSSYSTAAGKALPSVGALAKGVSPSQAAPYQSFTGESFSAEVAANGVDLTDPVSKGLVAASNVSVDFVAKTGSFSVAASALPGLTAALTAGRSVTVTLQAASGPNVEGLTFGGGGPTNNAVLTGASLDVKTGLTDVSFTFNGTPGTYAVGGGVGFLGVDTSQDQMVVTPEAAAAAGTAKFDIAFTNGLVPASLTADQLSIVDGKNDGVASGVTGTITLAPGTTAGTYVATVSGLTGSGPFSIDGTAAFLASVGKNGLSPTRYVGSEVLATDTADGTQSFAVTGPNAPAMTTTFSTTTGLPTQTVVLNPDADTQSVTTTYAADGTTPTLTATLLADGTYVTVAPASSGDPAGTATVTTTYASAAAATPLRTVYQNASHIPIESIDTSGSGTVTTVYAADGTTPVSVTTVNQDGSGEVYQTLSTGPFASSDVVHDKEGNPTQATYRRSGGVLAEIDTFGTDSSTTVAVYDANGAPLETTVTDGDKSKTVTQYEAAGPYASVTTTYDASGDPTGQTQAARIPKVTLDGTGGAVTTPTATVTGRIDIPGVAGTVQISVNGSAAGSPVALNADGSFSAVLPFAANGTYDVTATATTAAGGVGLTAAPVEYTVSDIAPTVAITTQAATSASAARTITGLVTASGTATVAGQPVTLTENGVALATAAPVTVGPDGAFSADVVLPAEGANAITVSVLDSLGNAASAAITETLDQVAPMVSSPTLTVASGAGPSAVGIAAPADDVSAPGALVITVGALPTDGTLTLADGRTPVAAGMTLSAGDLAGLLFTPTAGVADQSSPFTYTVADGARNTSTGTATLAVGGLPPAPPAAGGAPATPVSSPAAPAAPTSPAGPAVSATSPTTPALSPPPAPSALPAPLVVQNGDGSTTTTTRNPDGTTTTATSGGSRFDGKPYSAVADRRDAGGALLNEVRSRNDGRTATSVYQGGQTLASQGFGLFYNNGAPSSTFVFDPGDGRDVVSLFRVDGTDHDTLSLKGSDYGNSVATVLNHSRDTAAGLLITDPVASSPGPGGHDTVLLKGITKGQLAQNRADIAFHA